MLDRWRVMEKCCGCDIDSAKVTLQSKLKFQKNHFHKTLLKAKQAF